MALDKREYRENAERRQRERDLELAGAGGETENEVEVEGQGEGGVKEGEEGGKKVGKGNYEPPPIATF